MKNIVKFLLATVLVFAMQSCGYKTHYSTFKPYESHHYSQMNDLEACGETTIDIEYSSYLGIFHNIKTLNGEKYSGQNPKSVSMPNGVGGLLGKGAYKVLQQFPDAVYFQVIKKEKVSDRLFLGSYVKEKAVIRAYRFKK